MSLETPSGSGIGNCVEPVFREFLLAFAFVFWLSHRVSSRTDTRPTGLFITLFLAFATTALAVSVRPLSIAEMTRKSHLVLHAVVTAKTVQRDADGRIFTEVELRIQDRWKGQTPGENFSIVQSGGVLGDQIASVSGQPEYEIGEEIIAFLVLNQKGKGVTLGLAQGKFRVTQEPVGKTKFVHSVFHGQPPGLAKNRAGLSLESLKAEVKGVTP